MPKKPNFDFERRQREKAKALKSAEKEQAKKQKQQGAADGQPSNDVLSSATSPEAAASGNEAHAFSEKTASSE